MAIISKKKIILKVNTVLKNYLISNERSISLPISYKELFNYEDSKPLNDSQNEIHWETVEFPPDQKEKIYKNLIQVYAYLKADGDISVVQHLTIDRIDHYIYGETKPFRIRIINNYNKDIDFFYVKIADASRIYGLEIEHFLSPDRINYLVDKDTIVEEHIGGIPGEVFIKEHLSNQNIDKVRMLKEFVKFNERCFVRLLGDMHPGNFVIAATPDFEGVHYKIRAIDFDQQSYEGKKAIYLPQSYKRNKPFLDLGVLQLHPEILKQYQKEERALIAKRIRTTHNQIKKLTEAMARDMTSFPQHVTLLKEQLADHYKEREFLSCRNMGEVLVISLKQLFPKKK